MPLQLYVCVSVWGWGVLGCAFVTEIEHTEGLSRDGELQGMLLHKPEVPWCDPLIKMCMLSGVQRTVFSSITTEAVSYQSLQPCWGRAKWHISSFSDCSHLREGATSEQLAWTGTSGAAPRITYSHYEMCISSVNGLYNGKLRCRQTQ